MIGKSIVLLIIVSLLAGCAPGTMQFRLAPGTTQTDYQRAVQECGGSTQPGGQYCLFGPAILVLPAVAIIEGVKYVKKTKIQECVEAKGFKCIANCAKTSKGSSGSSTNTGQVATHGTFTPSDDHLDEEFHNE